jgi:hypothetical protein
MKLFKIVEKRRPNVMAVIMGKDAAHAIKRFKRLSGYDGDVVAVLTHW